MERHVGKAFVLEGLLISCNAIKDVIGLIMKHKSKEVVGYRQESVSVLGV